MEDLEGMKIDNLLVINVNGYATKFKFDNVYGCPSGARVFASECDHTAPCRRAWRIPRTM